MNAYTEVFIGNVIKLETIKNPYPGAKLPARKAKFKVLVQFKGKNAKIIDVVSLPHSSVIPDFVEGNDWYLVYAKKGVGDYLWAGDCATMNLSKRR